MNSSAPGSALIPRKYQEEIFSRAMQANIVAALDTGSGKTYIAALLMRWLAARHTGPRKIFVFLVPRVPLVEQQKRFLADQVPLTVRGYYGELVDQWEHDPIRWGQEFNECDVMVMTAQVFLDAMLHAHWLMSQVALIVFDEAHHARKNHPYNQIMRDFYFTCNPQDRPKVLGMTASPVWNAKQPQRALQELEDNLHAKVVGVLENQDELIEYSPKPDETIREYPYQTIYPTYPMSLWNQLAALDVFSNPNIVHENLENRYNTTLVELGPYGADFYLFSHLSRVISKLSREHHSEYLTTHEALVSKFHTMHGEELDPISVDSGITELSSRLIALEATLERFCNVVQFDNTMDVVSQWLCPKLQVLVSILAERKSTSFQGIVFVEQRQVASTLAWILPRVSELKGWILTGALVGHGGRDKFASSNMTQGMMEKKQRELISDFRTGHRNLLISTSVGEEGLDFQECDLIVRYNKLQNMVGYLQSRGRARHTDSTYIVMIPEESHEDYAQYAKMRQSEPELRSYYQNRHRPQDDQGEDNEPDDPVDVALRLRYEIKSTGAVLTFGSAISLLNRLCALIPRDKYTHVLKPTYEVLQFQATVELPPALPVPREHLRYEGALRRTKREAKASAAFVACKALHDLGVFDDYLLPARKTSGAIIEDADGRTIPEVGAVSEMIEVLVVDPWRAWTTCDSSGVTTSSDGWLYHISINGASILVGLVMANLLDFDSHLSCELGHVQIGGPVKVRWPSEGAARSIKLLHEFTLLGLRWCNTSKQIQTELTCFLVPVTPSGQPDFKIIQEVVESPTRTDIAILHEHENRVLLQNKLAIGRPLILRQVREDLTPMSRPLPSGNSAMDGQYDTYVEMLEANFGRGKREVVIPTEGPMLLVETHVRNFSSQYPVYPPVKREVQSESLVKPKKLQMLPAALCEVAVLPEYVQKAFRVFPQLVRRMTDIYRAREIIAHFGLPPLKTDLVIEALTLPCATAGFNNQRLETLGDSVLKLSVVVHLYNKYPFRHEGQLDGMKINSVCNRVLLARGKDISLERFLTCEPSTVRRWRPTAGDGTFADGVWHAKRKFPRKSLQDCMEALLAAGFLSGGIDMALHVGTALRLCFGGTVPWGIRYTPQEKAAVPRIFDRLQQIIGYHFKSSLLLHEAITHPSFQSESACYQRLEFLGDAMIDLVVIEFLYRKYPSATSGQLSRARSKAVCAPSLATLAINMLSLHQLLLSNNVELGKAISKAVPEHQQLSYKTIVFEGWKYEPPKALSDILESLVGAILVDTNFDYEQTKEVVMRIMGPVLEHLRPDLPLDPTSELMLYLARNGCHQAKFERFMNDPEKSKQNDSLRFRVHGMIVGSPLRSIQGLRRAKPILAQMVQRHLEDPISPYCLENICNCKAAANEIPHEELETRKDDLNDEVEEEFALLGIMHLRDVDGVAEDSVESKVEEEEADEARSPYNNTEDAEVEAMLGCEDMVLDSENEEDTG